MGGSWVRRLGAVGLLTTAAVMSWPAPAGAEVTGNCQATIAGQDVRDLDSHDPDDAIEVKRDDVITATASTDRPVGDYKIELEIPLVGVPWTVASGTSDTNSWTREVKVSTYTQKVKSGGTIRVIGSGGGCTGAALISIDYDGRTPLATPLGFGAALLTALGLGGLLLSIRRAARR